MADERRTKNLGLPLDMLGHIQTEQNIIEAFKKIDEAIGNLGGTDPSNPPATPTAADITVIPPEGFTGTTVQEILIEVATRLVAVEAAVAGGGA